MDRNAVIAERNLTITLRLTEVQARDVYLHLNPKYHPNSCGEIKEAITKCLGYKPVEHDI